MRAASAVFVLFLLSTTQAGADAKTDACIFDALALVPKIQGLTVTSLKGEPSSRNNIYTFMHVLVSVEAEGRSVRYKFICRADNEGQVSIIKREIVSN